MRTWHQQQTKTHFNSIKRRTYQTMDLSSNIEMFFFSYLKTNDIQNFIDIDVNNYKNKEHTIDSLAVETEHMQLA